MYVHTDLHAYIHECNGTSDQPAYKQVVYMPNVRRAPYVCMYVGMYVGNGFVEGRLVSTLCRCLGGCGSPLFGALQLTCRTVIMT